MESLYHNGHTYREQPFSQQELDAMPKRKCAQCGDEKTPYVYRHWETAKKYYRVQWSCKRCIAKRAREKRHERDRGPKGTWSLEEILRSERLHVRYMTGALVKASVPLRGPRGWF